MQHLNKISDKITKQINQLKNKKTTRVEFIIFWGKLFLDLIFSFVLNFTKKICNFSIASVTIVTFITLFLLLGTNWLNFFTLCGILYIVIVVNEKKIFFQNDILTKLVLSMPLVSIILFSLGSIAVTGMFCMRCVLIQRSKNYSKIIGHIVTIILILICLPFGILSGFFYYYSSYFNILSPPIR